MQSRENQARNRRRHARGIGVPGIISLQVNKLIRAGYLNTLLMKLVVPFMPLRREMLRMPTLMLSLYFGLYWGKIQRRNIERLGPRYHLNNYAGRDFVETFINVSFAYLEISYFFSFPSNFIFLLLMIGFDRYVGKLNPRFGEDPFEMLFAEILIRRNRDPIIEAMYQSIYSNQVMLIDPRPYFSEVQFSWLNHDFHSRFIRQIQRELREWYLDLLTREDLIVLDGYAFSTEELIAQAENNPENYYRNPHQNPDEDHDFSETAAHKMLKDPALKPYSEKIKLILETQASRIQEKTLDAVINFLHLLHQHQVSGSVQANQNLQTYLGTLGCTEHFALLDYIILVKFLLGGYQNLKFKDAISGSNAQCIQIAQVYGWQFVIDLRPDELKNIPEEVRLLAKSHLLNIQVNPLARRQPEVKEEKEPLSPRTRRNLDAFVATQRSYPVRFINFIHDNATNLLTSLSFFANFSINARAAEALTSGTLNTREDKDSENLGLDPSNLALPLIVPMQMRGRFMTRSAYPNGIFHPSLSQAHHAGSAPSSRNQESEWKEGKPSNEHEVKHRPEF